MRIKIKKLSLLCRKGEEVVEFSDHLTYIHGKMSKGKSSVVRLIDYCFGGKLEYTPALQKELSSVSLELFLGKNNVLIERSVDQKSYLNVSWIDSVSQQVYSLVVNIKGNSKDPLIGEDVYNFSDLMFFLMGHDIKKVRSRTGDFSSKMIRLGFRDFYKFCFLDQDHLDSDFFRFDSIILKEKSKDVLNYVTGFFSEKLLHLHDNLSFLVQEERNKRASAEEFKKFLKGFGHPSIESIDEEIDALKSERERLERAVKLEESPSAHINDKLKEEIYQISSALNHSVESYRIISGRKEDQTKLVAELITMKFKSERNSISEETLSNVDFECCPACGTGVAPLKKHDAACYLCKVEEIKEEESVIQKQAIKKDIDARISDLKSSIILLDKSLKTLDRKISDLNAKKIEIDKKISNEIEGYETDYLARTLNKERRLSVIHERIANLNDIKKMPEAIEALFKEADALLGGIEKEKRLIEEEEDELLSAEINYKRIQESFKAILLEIGFPGFSEEDSVVIDSKRQLVEIWKNGREEELYNFFDLGSGGKKVLFKICFALALHEVAESRNLPLPRLLIIDTPTKNISTNKNKEVLEAFFNKLYSLLLTNLNGTQVIIVEQDKFLPLDENGAPVDISALKPIFREMEPPLISYYDGP